MSHLLLGFEKAVVLRYVVIVKARTTNQVLHTTDNTMSSWCSHIKCSVFWFRKKDWHYGETLVTNTTNLPFSLMS